MSKAPSMPMYWDAYIADTTHLSCEEHGAYLMLLGAMWRRNGWVPDEDKDNARILGLTAAKWRRVKARLSTFLIIENGHITQQKLLKTWKKTQETIAKNKDNGAKGGYATASKNNNLGSANATNSLRRKATIPEPEPEPIKKDTSASKKTGADLFGDPKPKAKLKRATAIPENWVPSDRNAADALSKNLSHEEIKNEGVKFRDHHLARGSTFKNWDAAWRTWVANSIKFNRPGNGRGMATGTTPSEIADRGSSWARRRAARGGTGGNS